ncbi:spermidine synthase [Paraliomyxa miuraensis]|uniref:spermidine synthase n=1 Tax=Paraliomyxa miuraensis TaxID=376150 RepID=UPI00225BE09B|nr:hypothetical protein [Paraliomyxa miuraensis]MCX4247540.1 hypothetical protein [Paraliomyxa miuraensis]
MDHRRTYAGVFLVALATLVLEILLTRITSVVAWYHLAFFVISLAMLGMTAGAVIVFVRPSAFTDELVPRRATQACLALAATAPVAVAVALMIPLQPITSTEGFATMLAYGGALAVPFTVSGVVLTLVLTRAGLPPGRVYGVDLVGAATGCGVVIPLLDWLDAPSAVLVASALAALAALAFAAARSDASASRHRRMAGGLALVLLALGLLNAALEPPWLRARTVKGQDEDPSQHLYTGWNTYSRVTVDQTLVLPPLMWAPGRMIPLPVLAPLPQRGIKIDGAAGTVMAAFDRDPTDGRPGSPLDHEYLDWDVTAFAHHLRPSGPAAVIGVGGGRDVLEAVRVGHSPVVGIELNALIVALHEGSMREFSGISGLPGVHLVHDEARAFMARDPQRYDVITMSLIDTWASTGAGAYALSENGLYTVEGWRIFLSRLTPTGIFTVSRWYKSDSPGETARMLALAMETLWSLGAKEPQRHLMMLQNLNIATILVSPSPLSNADVKVMFREAAKRGFNVLLAPGRLPRNPMLAELAAQPDRAAMWAFATSQTLDLTPPTDARPFFFNMIKPATWLSGPEEVDELDYAFLGNLHATQTLVYATAISALLTLFAVLVPLWSRRRDLRAYPRLDVLACGTYFALIGLGFMFVEMGLLSRLNVFLGHPTLALAVLLGGIIFFTGVGSMVSGRVPLQRPWVARLYPLVPGGLVLIAGALLDPVMGAYGAAGTPVRVLLGLSLVAVPALGLGLGFPLGLRLVDGLRASDSEGDGSPPPLGPWMWGINGACGVVASGLALTSSMAWGISTTLIIGAGCYLVLPLCSAHLQHAIARRG